MLVHFMLTFLFGAFSQFCSVVSLYVVLVFPSWDAYKVTNSDRFVCSTRPCILGAFRGVAHKAGKHDCG